jgi:hypothetical protein
VAAPKGSADAARIQNAFLEIQSLNSRSVALQSAASRPRGPKSELKNRVFASGIVELTAQSTAACAQSQRLRRKKD